MHVTQRRRDIPCIFAVSLRQLNQKFPQNMHRGHWMNLEGPFGLVSGMVRECRCRRSDLENHQEFLGPQAYIASGHFVLLVIKLTMYQYVGYVDSFYFMKRPSVAHIKCAFHRSYKCTVSPLIIVYIIIRWTNIIPRPLENTVYICIYDHYTNVINMYSI